MYHLLSPLHALVLQNIHLPTQRCSVQGPSSQEEEDSKRSLENPFKDCEEELLCALWTQEKTSAFRLTALMGSGAVVSLY